MEPIVRPPRDWVLLTLLALLFSSAVLMTQIVVDTIPPVTTVAARLLIAVPLLYFVMRHNGQNLPPLLKTSEAGRNSIAPVWFFFMALGLLGNTIPFSLMAVGQTRIDASVASILLAFMPLATIVLAHFFDKEDKLTVHKTVGFCIGFAGLVVLFQPWRAFSASGGDTPFYLLFHLAVLGAALCYAVNTIVARRMPDVDPITAACAVSLCGLTATLPVMFLLESPFSITPSSNAIVLLLALGIFPTGIATIFYLMLVKSAGASFLSLTNYLVPILTVLLGALLLGERLGWNGVGALFLILAGIAISQLAPGFGRQTTGIAARFEEK